MEAGCVDSLLKKRVLVGLERLSLSRIYPADYTWPGPKSIELTRGSAPDRPLENGDLPPSEDTRRGQAAGLKVMMYRSPLGSE